MNLAGFGSTFLALGPPAILLAGTAVTVVAAVHLTGPRMWWALALGPLLTLGSALAGTWLVITVLQPGEGSGFLLGAAALGLYAMLVTPYYLVLASVGLFVGFRNSRVDSAPVDPDLDGITEDP